MAAEQNYFHLWQSSPTIGSSLKIIWEMSVHYERALSLDPNYSRAADALENIRFIREHSGLK